MKIIHRITNIFTSELELIESSRIDETYDDDNKLTLLVAYNDKNEVSRKKSLFSETKNSLVYKEEVFKDGECCGTTFFESTWNDDRTVLEEKYYDKDKILTSEDISFFANNKLYRCTSYDGNHNEVTDDRITLEGDKIIKQILINDGVEEEINYHYGDSGNIVMMEEFRDGQKTVVTKYTKENGGERETRYLNGKILDSQYSEKDLFNRVVVFRDYNSKNEKLCEAEFKYDKFGEKIMEAFSGDLSNSFIKRFYSYGKPNEMTYIENIYKYVDEKEWIVDKEFMGVEMVGEIVYE